MRIVRLLLSLACLGVFLVVGAGTVLPAGAQTTAANEWTWVGGSQTLVGDATVYGTLGVPSATNTPGARFSSQSWKDAGGNLWLFGGQDFRNDLWRFGTTTLQWTWMGGAQQPKASGTYGTLGAGVSSNVPGGRQGGATWVDSQGRGWVFGGTGYDSAGVEGEQNDLWMYDPSTGFWTWEGGSSAFGSNCVTDGGGVTHCSELGSYGSKGTGSTQNIPPGRTYSATWVDPQGNFWLFGGWGWDVTNDAKIYYNDLWEFSPSTGVWTWQAGNNDMSKALCYIDPDLLYYPICGYPGVYGTEGVAASGNLPGSRTGMGFSTDASGNFWLVGGQAFDKNGASLTDSGGNISTINDLWMFNPSSKQWTWVTGADDETSSITNGVWGTFGIASPGNSPPRQYLPSIWKDKNGYIWLFGYDLWRFDPTSNQWAWIQAQGYLGQEATAQEGVPSPENVPNYRYGTVTWTDPSGQDLYMYGGCTTLNCQVDEMWEFQELVNPLPQAPAPLFSTGGMEITSGTYTGFLRVEIILELGKGTTYYTTDGSTPTSSSKRYGGTAIPVSSTTTLQAITTSPFYTPSPVASVTLTFPQQGSSGSQVSISSSDNPSSLTESVTFTATVTGASGTPTGSVIFSAGSVILDQQPLSGGSAQTTLSNLPLGSNSVTASYSGDVTYAAGTSAAYTQQVGTAVPASSGEWTISRVAGQGSYSLPNGTGFTDTPAPRGGAAGWMDKAGNLWLFGGVLDGSYMNDLMKYSPTSNTWTWISGNSPYATGNQGSIGTLGAAAPGNSPSGRTDASSWGDSSGNFWLFGGWGYDWQGALGYYNDVWKYDPTAQQWTWLNGSSTLAGNGAAVGVSASYGTLGVASTQNYPSGRFGAASWSDGQGHVWIFGGAGVNSTNEMTTVNPANLGDFWEYDQSANAWEWLGGGPLVSTTGVGIYGTLGVASGKNLPGARSGASAWRDASGNLWLYGGVGLDAKGNLGFLSDLWIFNPQSSEWTWVGGSSSTSSQNQPVYGVQGTAAPTNSPGSREDATTWTDSKGLFWLFGGVGIYGSNSNNYLFNDLWMLNPSTNQWTWIGGPNTSSCAPVPAGYCGPGTVGVPGTSNLPASRDGGTGWADAEGNLWLFGGLAGLQLGESLNDLWKYQIPGVGLQPTTAPTFSVPGGTYATNQSVAIMDSTIGATIYYTTNGTLPTASSTVYSGPIPVNSTETIEAIAAASGYSTSAVATATYTIPQSFSLSMNPTSMTVTAGASGSTTVTVQDEGGFNGNVSFACSGLPAGAGCSFTTLTVPTAAGVSYTTLTVTTSSTTAEVRRGAGALLPGAAMAVVVCCFGLRRRRRLLMLVLLGVGLAGLGVLGGCGSAASSGGGGGGGTQPVTSTVTVTATSGTLTQTATFTLTVN